VKKVPGPKHRDGSRKKSKARPTVIESSDDSESDDNNKKKTHAAEIEKVPETPEDELGELSMA
jgi:hypothetical protein